MNMYDIIADKRDGKELSYEQLKYYINGICDETIPDYQSSALLMAIFLNGMNHREIAQLTDLMARSGDMIDLSEIKGIKVDKHSTGGVGDKTTLVISPIVSACGGMVAKMSGRALGHEGGTIDKLESIPGFRVAVSSQEFIDNVNKIGCCIAGQTGSLAVADKKIYAIRDVTATVDSIPLIASSIMSKKLASGADKIVLDVKVGNGALMKTIEEATELANLMVQIGERNGRETIAYLTDMDRPLGCAIGNLLEVREAYQTVCGNGPEDLTAICLDFSAEMLALGGKGTFEECRIMAINAIKDGSAEKQFRRIIENQGGDMSVIENPLAESIIAKKIYSAKSGYITHMNTTEIGKASMALGAGRAKKDDEIDYTAGIVLQKKTEDYVNEGELLATLYTSNPDKINSVISQVAGAFTIEDTQPTAAQLVLGRVDKDGIKWN